MVEEEFNRPLKLRRSAQAATRLLGRRPRAKKPIDSSRIPPLLFAPMKNVLILVVGLRMGKAV
jgi:hypothetical protein